MIVRSGFYNSTVVGASLIPETTQLRAKDFVDKSASDVFYHSDFDFNSHNMMSVRSSVQLLTSTFDNYTTLDDIAKEQIISFLSANYATLNVIQNTFEKIGEYLKPSKIELVADKYDNDSVNAVVTVTSEPEETLENLNKFDNEFFLQQIKKIQGKFNIQIKQQ